LPTTSTLPTLTAQAERLLDLGVPAMARIDPRRLRDLAARGPASGDALLVVHPRHLPPSTLTPLLRYAGKPGFLVVDMPDVDDFVPVPSAALPDTDLYVVTDVDRGDELANWSPDEALPHLVGRGRTPLTLSEGIQWLLHRPDMLERNRCFMTIGSRKPKGADRLDSRTPAIWISNGTGRDGRENRNAPKVGWCWAGNRHTWLGFASASGRSSLPEGEA